MQTKNDLHFKNYLDYLEKKGIKDKNEVMNLIEKIKKSE
jgi:hypothetical protein